MYLILIIGHTGQGKTPYVNNFLGNGHKPPVAPAVKGKYFATEKSKRQYIFDVNNEYLFADDNTGKIRNQMRHTDLSIEKFIQVAKSLSNTNIVIEDATGFLRGKQSSEFSRLLTRKRFTQNNYLILFHSINRVPPELMEMCDCIVLFKTHDNIDIVKNKFENKELTEAFLELQIKEKYSLIEIKRI